MKVLSKSIPRLFLRLYALIILGIFFFGIFSKEVYSAICDCDCGTFYCSFCSPPQWTSVCVWDVCDACPCPWGSDAENCIDCSSCGGGGCFTGDTKVATPGREKEIKNIKEGDVVKSFDSKTGEIKESTVSGIHKTTAPGYWFLKTESGREVKVTGEHPILVLNEKGEKVWRTVEEIEVGDYTFVLGEDGNVIEKANTSPELEENLGDKDSYKEKPSNLPPGYEAVTIVEKKTIEENGKKYILLKFNNGKEARLPADSQLPIKDGKIYLDPQMLEEKPSGNKTNLLKTLFSSLMNFVEKIF